jgi:hypothetical protein
VTRSPGGGRPRPPQRRPQPPSPGTNGWGVGGFALGVLALVLSITSLISHPFLVATVAAAALVLSVLGLRAARRHGRRALWSVLGLVAATIPLLLSVLWLGLVATAPA